MKLGNFVFKDISEHPRNPRAGSFLMELYPQPDVGETIYDTGSLGWIGEVFGSVDATDFIPGHTNTYSMTDWNPPFIAFQVRDYTTQTVQDRIKEEVTDPILLEKLEGIKSSQLDLKRTLSAPSVPVAIASKLLGQLIAKEQVSDPDASAMLQEQFGLTDMVSKGLIQRGKEMAFKGLNPAS